MKVERPILLLLILAATFCGPAVAQAATYTLTITANHGAVAKYPDQASYDAGTVVRLVPRPNVGYSFRSWSGDVPSKALVGTITMDSNKSITANFGTWVAPIGIPDPNWGMAQTYRMYDDPANRNTNLTYTQNAEGGYYTHYVDNTSGASTDSSTQSNITDPLNLTNPGTLAKPRKTIPANYPDGSVVEGSVIEVHGGPYSYSLAGGQIPLTGSGSAAKPIFIRGYDPVNRTVMSKYGLIGLNTSLYLAHYLVIENLDFYNAADEGTMNLTVDPPSHHIAIRNCDIHGVHAADTGMAISYNGVEEADYPNYILILACRIHGYGHLDASTDEDHICLAVSRSRYIWILDNEMYEASGGMVCNAYNAANNQYSHLLHHVYAGRNIIHDCLQAALWVKSAADVVYSQNEVYHMRISPNDNGDAIGKACGFGWQYTPLRTWYLFNRIHDIQGYGCYAGSSQYCDTLGVIGNVVYDTTHRVFNISSIDADLYFANNTIYDTDDGVYTYQVSGDLKLENNIFAKIRDASTNNIDIVYDTSKTTLTKNLIYQPSASVKIVWGSENTVYTVAQLQAAVGRCTGNLELNPLFSSVDSNDFTLASNSPAINVGTESTVYDTFYDLYGIDIKKDINGNARTGTWDIGAYEYVVSAITNLAVSGTSQNSLTLGWAVPGETGVTGQPASYDIRYTVDPITEANWEAATQVQGEPVAGSFGTQESFTIAGLNPGATYYFGIKVLDEAGHASDLSDVVAGTTATSGNHAPVLTPIGDKSVVAGGTLTFSVGAEDADPDDTLTYSASGLPTGAGFNPATRTFAWTPTSSQLGTHHASFQVGDGHVVVSETITITVRDAANHAPELGPIGNQSVSENASLSFLLSATDQDGDSLTFSATGVPSGASLVSGAFNWTPTYEQAGSYPVTFTVSDGSLTDTEQITITVADVSDRTAPAAHDFLPAADAFQVPVNTLVALTISDDGSGIDAGTVAISVNNQLVYSGGESLYQSDYGVCRRTGTRASYRYYYQPAQAFAFDQHVSVYVTATDAAHNAMVPVFYQFVTEMQSFGRNQAVSAGSDSSGHAAIATDSQGNLWAAWHAGQAGARDVYVAKRSRQLQTWDAPLRLTNLASDQCNPAIAIGSDDTLYIVWQDNRRGNWDIYVSASQDGSTWGGPVRVTDSNDNQVNPVVAIDHASPYHVYIAWERGNAGSRDIYLASSNTSFASKTITRVTSDPADQAEPALAVGSDNTVYLVWTDQRNSSADIYGSSSSASSWANIPIVTGPGNQSHPALAVEPGTSTLHVLWMNDAAGNLDVMHGASNGLPGSPISGTNIVDDATGADQAAPVIAAAKDHWNNTHVYACWQDNRSVGSAHDSDLYFVEIRSGAGGTNILVGDDGTNANQSDPALGCDEYGQPVIGWTDSRGSVPRIYSACSTYSKPVALASAQIARSAGGRVGVDPASISHDEDVSIQIPASASDCDVTVGISEIQNLPKFAAPCIAGYEIGPSGVQFSFPATVTIPYTGSGSGRATPYWYDAQTGALSQQGMTEITNRTLANGIPVVSFKTTHLTTFYVLENSLATGGSGGGGCAMSSSQHGSVAAFLIPYGALALFMMILKRRDRRHKKT